MSEEDKDLERLQAKRLAEMRKNLSSQQDQEKIANHAYYTFWYVLPTLPMFLLFPFLLKNLGFWFAFILSILFTIAFFLIYAQLLKRFGIHLTSF